MHLLSSILQTLEQAREGLDQGNQGNSYICDFPLI